MNTVSSATMPIELMPVGWARAVSRAFFVAAFSATSSIASFCSLLAAFSLSLIARLARAWARFFACLCSRDGVVVVDWLEVDCIGKLLSLFGDREPKQLLVRTSAFSLSG